MEPRRQRRISRLLTGPRVTKTGKRVPWDSRVESCVIRTGLILLTLGGGWCIVTAHTLGGVTATPFKYGEVCAFIGLGLLGLFLLGLIVVFFVGYGRWFGRQLDVASTHVPTPAEISVLLQQEWGRPATVEEVYAVHRMLTDKRNEAAIGVGLALGATLPDEQASSWQMR